jgi:hypothetical protein
MAIDYPYEQHVNFFDTLVAEYLYRLISCLKINHRCNLSLFCHSFQTPICLQSLSEPQKIVIQSLKQFLLKPNSEENSIRTKISFTRCV